MWSWWPERQLNAIEVIDRGVGGEVAVRAALVPWLSQQQEMEMPWCALSEIHRTRTFSEIRR